MSGGGGEGFLSRWSRRKRELEREDAQRDKQVAPRDEAPPEEARTQPQAVESQAPADEAPSEEVLSEEELAALPPIETIDASTDITAFLRKGIPAALRNAALRRAWASDPKIAGYLDPARDYAYDWNVPGGVPGSGPLSPDFDAKALAEKIFRGSSTKVEDEDEVSDRDIVSQTVEDVEQKAVGRAAAAEPMDNAGEVRQREVAAEEPAEVLPGKDSHETAELRIASAENAPERGEIRPKSRRHGGARPL